MPKSPPGMSQSSRKTRPPPPIRVPKYGHVEQEAEGLAERDGRAEFEVRWIGLDGPGDNTWEL